MVIHGRLLWGLLLFLQIPFQPIAAITLNNISKIAMAKAIIFNTVSAYIHQLVNKNSALSKI
jgi:hypothetical protein